MVTMNKVALFSSFLLASSSLLAPTHVSCFPLIKTPEELDECRRVGRSKIFEVKAKEIVETFRLSHLGDFSNSSNPFDFQRRLFYMLKDEDSFFHSVGLARQQALELWLGRAGDYEVRRLASDEIYEMFMADFTGGEIDPQDGLPAAMKAKPRYIGFQNELRNIIAERLTVEDSPTFNPHSLAYFVLLNRERQLKDRIKREYCADEEVYRDYVNLVLNDRQKSIVLGARDQKGFAAALAFIQGKELSVWNFNETGDSLDCVYNYRPLGFFNGKWELYQDETHFNRLVRVNDLTGLEQAKRDEDDHLKTVEGLLENEFKAKTNNKFNRLELARMEALAESDFVPPAEGVEYGDQAFELRNNITNADKLPSEKSRASYYKAHIYVLTKEVEKLRKEIDRTFFISPLERAAALAGNRILREKVERIEREQAEHALNLPQLRENLESTERAINQYTQLLTPLAVNPSELSVAGALLRITLRYGNLAEEAEKIGLDDTHDEETRNRFRELSEETLVLKKLYGDRFDELQNKIYRDIGFQVRLNASRAERRHDHYLNQNLMLEGVYSFRGDFDEAQRVLTTVLNEAPENAKYFNPSYLSADPFLNSDRPDMNEVYPNDISKEEWKDLRDQLKADILYFLLPEPRRNLLGNAPGLVPTINSEYDVSIELNGERVDFLSDEALSREFEGLNQQDLLHAYFGVQSFFKRLKIYDDNEFMADQKNLARKLTKWIVDVNVANGQTEDDNLVEIKKSRVKASLMLAQTRDRCPDGVISGLDIIEDQLLKKGSSTESEISTIFSSYAHHYFQKYSGLASIPMMGQFNADEWSTNASQFAEQRLFLSVPNRGQPRTTFYALPQVVRNEADTIFNPRNLMTIFLKGGQVTHGDKTISFTAFTAEKAIDLLYEAYLRGLQRTETGHKLTVEHLKGFIDRDPYLEHVYTKYLEDLGEGNQINSAFFESNVPNTNLEFQRVFKKPFFEYILIELGYIIDPTNTWETKRRRFFDGHLDEFPTQEDAGPTVPAYQPTPVVVRGTVPPPPERTVPPQPEEIAGPQPVAAVSQPIPVVAKPTPVARKGTLRSKKMRSARKSRAPRVKKRVRVSRSRINKRRSHRRVARKRVRVRKARTRVSVKRKRV